ncbi:MAG: Cache 3/Cache 2 fusion domain-containing protein [Spirochaetes bacterium]|nr:Cache 3/Cache 2 fusion domain-containing protein [Spirochaetota bacterium]
MRPDTFRNLIDRIKPLTNMLAFKLLMVFFISAGTGTLIFFIANYFIVKNNIKKIVIDDLQTTANIIYDAIDLHFSDDAYREEFKQYLDEGSVEIDFDSRFNELKYRIKRIKLGQRGYVYVVNTKGDVFMHPELEGDNLSKLDFIKEMIQKKKGVMEYSWEGNKQIAAFRYYAPFEWIIIAGNYYSDFMDRPMNKVILWSLVIIVIETAIMIVVLFLLIRNIIIIPINSAKQIANSISSGDLTVRVEKSGNDEISVMMAAMAEILSTQKGVISDMAGHITKLTASSEEMAVISNKMSKMSQDHAAAMEEASAALEETLASMEQITGKTDMQYQNVDQNAARMAKMAAEAEHSYNEAVKVNNLITDTSANAMLGEQDLDKMVDEMQNIKESTSKIEEIIKIISDISEQVNLLALNAAIEAARAGEHGRGFAVVADEISKLADETAQSAKTITQLVNEGNEQVDSGTEIVNRTAKTFQSIIQSIEAASVIVSKFAGTLKLLAETASEAQTKTNDIKSISNEISLSTKEQMSTNKEMSVTVEKVNSDSQEVVGYADAILKTSQEIGELSAEIKIQLDKFKIA